MRSFAWLLLAAGTAVAAEIPAPSAPPANGAPFLWEVQAGATKHFLLGSVHLLPASVHPLPAALDQAYAATEELVLETDLAALSTPEVQNRLVGAARDDREGGLKGQIGKSLFAKLQRRAGELGMPTPVCEGFRAWFCALALELYPLQQAQFSMEFGIDQHFYTRARDDGRPIAGLESAAFQVGLFAEMPEATSRQLLAATLDERTYSSQTPGELHRIWRTGDVATLDRLIKDMRQRYPELNARLLAERNRSWLPVLAARLKGDVPQLVIVGAAHFVGPEGLLALLKAQGIEAKPASAAATGL
jgi:uncharacterized protein